MLFLKAKSTSDQTELFPLDKIINFVPGSETTKILLGANMFWRVYTDSIEVLDLAPNQLETLLKGGKPW